MYCSIVVRISAAVAEVLLPILNDMKTDLNNLNELYSNLNATVSNLEETVSNLEETVSDLNETVEEHKSQTSSEHTELHNPLETFINNPPTNVIAIAVLVKLLPYLNNIEENLCEKIDESTNILTRELEQNVIREVKKTYDLLEEHVGYTCGGEGGWRRVVYLDMTDPNTNCPSGWQLTSYSKRTCGKVNTGGLTCDSVSFPVTGGAYTRVCGRIRAYQVGRTDAFEAYDEGHATTIDGAYVSGVSLTHGSPRQHIWTFAAGASEDIQYINDACPCDATINIDIPPFVGECYFCESGKNSSYGPPFAEADPLWDGKGCTSTSTCCEMNNPPYFTKQLTSPTTDDIEARLCRLDIKDDTPIEFIELYVK